MVTTISPNSVCFHFVPNHNFLFLEIFEITTVFIFFEIEPDVVVIAVIALLAELPYVGGTVAFPTSQIRTSGEAIILRIQRIILIFINFEMNTNATSYDGLSSKCADNHCIFKEPYFFKKRKAVSNKYTGQSDGRIESVGSHKHFSGISFFCEGACEPRPECAARSS